jgi:selenide,water dikinase
LDQSIALMKVSNRAASSAAVARKVHAMTDVSGNGLLGHLCEMLDDGLGAELVSHSLPVLDAAKRLATSTNSTVYINGNRDYVRTKTTLSGKCDHETLVPLLDPQTNGGLLVACDERDAAALEGQGFQRIGRVRKSRGIEIL